MGEITGPTPVKLFVGMLARDTTLLTELTEKFMVVFGPVDFASPVWPWMRTKYYENEMGPGLKRQFIFFEQLIHPGTIAEAKLTTDDLEKQFLSEKGGRRINLDPGYLDAAKLVLASTKDFSHRIYLDKGIYGEVTLSYSGKTYQPLPYTFPDYRREEYIEVFKKARDLYMQAVR